MSYTFVSWSTIVKTIKYYAFLNNFRILSIDFPPILVNVPQTLIKRLRNIGTATLEIYYYDSRRSCYRIDLEVSKQSRYKRDKFNIHPKQSF